MSTPLNFDDISYLNEPHLFGEYNKYLNSDILFLQKSDDDLTFKSSGFTNKENNSQLDEKLDYNLDIPHENCVNLINDLKQKQFNSSDAKFLSKKRKKLGRIPKNCTEIGEHTSVSEDNQYDKNWRLFFKLIINSFNGYFEQKYPGKDSPTLFSTNVKNQFGSSNVKREQFIKTKIYKVLIFDPFPNKKYKTHREFGYKNEKIIWELVINKKDELFTALMKLDIETILNIFIGNEKNINIKGKEYDLSNFKILNDYIEEKKDGMKDDKKSKLEISDEIFLYKNTFFNLIQFIKNQGKVKSRKKELDEKDIIIYRIIEELEQE